MSNVLLNSSSLPQFSHIAPECVAPTIEQLLAQNRETIAALVHQPTPTWQSLPAQLEELDDTLSKAWSIVSHLNAVTNSPAWREAYNGCLAKISAYYTELGQNSDLYNSYQTLADSNEFAQLSPLREIDKWVRRKLRCYLWKQWGPAGYRELRKRGVTVREAWNTSKSAHGPWRLSKTPALAFALPLRFFINLGLPSLAPR